MAIRPTGGFPGWASGPSGAPVITVPTTTKRALGWQVSEVPPSSTFNWAMALYYQWIKYLDDGVLQGETAVKSLVVSAYGPTGASAIPGTIRVDAISASGTANIGGASHAHGTIYRDSIVSAWGIFVLTGVSGFAAPVKSFNFQGVTHPSVGVYRALFTNPPSNNYYVAFASAAFDAANSPGRTGYGQALNVRVSETNVNYVEVRCYDGYMALQDPLSGFYAAAIGLV